MNPAKRTGAEGVAEAIRAPGPSERKSSREPSGHMTVAASWFEPSTF
jgi:hypothetical protein